MKGHALHGKDEDWFKETRTMTSCGATHACGGVCWMYNVDGAWLHHCDDPSCAYAARIKKESDR